MLKKIQTNYMLTENVQLVVNEEYPENICLIEYGENCSGVLKRWFNKSEMIKELKQIICALENYNN